MFLEKLLDETHRPEGLGKMQAWIMGILRGVWCKKTSRCFCQLSIKQIQPIEQFTKLLLEFSVYYFPQSKNSSGISERESTILTSPWSSPE